MEAIKSIRNIRAEAEAAPGRKLRAVILAEGEGAAAMESCRRYIMNLANITEILLTSDKKETPDEAMSAIITGAEIFIPLDDLLDYKAEFERLSREKKKLEDEVARLEKKLSNEGFVAKAPPQIIAEEREKAAGYQDKLEKIQERLDLVARKC
jgi:valyl-tRNA synthetase